MNNNALLCVKGLKKYFPIKKGFLKKKAVFVKAVDGVDINIQKGETLGLVGESGCGKSTLGRCIIRLISPTDEEIYFENEDIMKQDAGNLQRLRRNMQIIFQEPYS